MPAVTAPAPGDRPTPPGAAGDAPPFVGSPPAKAEEAARLAKRNVQYLRNQRVVAISYAIDGLVMLMFWLAGTVSWAAAVIYTLTGLASCALASWVIRRGWNQRLRNPNISLQMSLTSSCLQLLCMALFPQINFMFALILFIIYISLTLLVPVKQAALAWVGISLGVILVLGLTHTQMRIPDANLTEQLLSWSFFALTLLRCIWLGTHNTLMTALLKKRSGELAELMRQVEQLAHHDELTGLLNRRSLMTILTEEQHRSDRMGSPLCVAILDLDKFKAVNDTLGHLAGDTTLKIFAQAAQHLARKTDRFGRYGGEEFLLVLTGTEAETARIPIERIRRTMREADWSTVAPGFSITFSCGIACYRPGETTEEFVKRADDALYRAKNEGRDCSRLG